MRTAATILAALLLSLSSTASAADAPGSRDDPLVTRYPGSRITWYDQQEHEPYVIAVGPVTGYRQIKETKPVEGRVTRIEYKLWGQRSFYEVYSNYLDAVRKAGFQILAEGFEKTSSPGGAVGQRGFLQVHYKTTGLPPQAGAITAGTATSGGSAYFAAYLNRTQGPVHVVVGAAQHSQDQIVVVVDVIEGGAMEQGLVSVDAEAMARGIDAEGRIALYGIHFDHDKATLRSESDQTLTQIARLLSSRPALGVYVVGHTDGTGKREYNQELSQERAAAVVDALVQRHGVARQRLEPHGVGPLAPVASNATDSGRSKNRRVELVER
jgi:outer membrane protein OmpA-like peptidoglycan-associated protein